MNLSEGTIIAVNKPKNITSHDVVNKLRKISGIKRVGHGGTLDPLASGVLVVAIGRSATKQLEKYVQGEKEYEAVIKLGQTSTTDDEEGEKVKTSDKQPHKEEISKVISTFIGTISQTPPVYSALKIKGKPAYKYARENKNTDKFMDQFKNTKTRKVEVSDIQLLKYSYPLLSLKITCGKGVYIRSLARDIGEKLNSGAYLADLTRTRVAEFTLNQAENIKGLGEREK